MSKSGLPIGIGLLLLLGGLIVGPGYYLYCTHLSGTLVGQFAVSGATASQWPVPDGTTLKFGGAGAFKPFSLDLDPGMNPVRFIWSVSTSSGSDLQYNQYRASLYHGGRRVMEEGVGVSHNRKDAGTQRTWRSLGAFHVPQAGRYHFALEQVAAPMIPVSGMEIEVRRNIMLPNLTVVYSALAVLVAGFFLIWIPMMWSLRRPVSASLDSRGQDVISSVNSHPLIVLGDKLGKAAVAVGIAVIIVFAGVVAYLLYQNQ